MFGNTIKSIGNFATGAFNTITQATGSALEFVAGLPNEIIDFGESLGNTIFGGAKQVADSETRQAVEREAVEFEARRAGGQAGVGAANAIQNLLNNPLLLAVGIGGLFALFLRRS